MDGRSAGTPTVLSTGPDRSGEAPAGQDDEDTMPNLERLVVEAMALAEASSGDGSRLAELVNRFWRLVPDEDLVGRTASQMLAAVNAHLDLAQRRRPGQLKLAVERNGSRTAVLVVTDDMPFLVDSVTGAVTQAGLDLELLAHPQVVVSRDASGSLTQISPRVDPDDAGPGQAVESWMRVEVTLLDDEAVTRLRNDLQRVLTDVREAVEDWHPMRQKALDLADALERTPRSGSGGSGTPLPVPKKDISDTVELLRWLADDNFTFVGYREYHLRAEPTGAPRGTTDGQVPSIGAGPPEQMLDAVPGTGLGILRRESPEPPAHPAAPVSASTQEAVTRLRARRLLTITKANARSTVHRPSYLDYIGIKIFDAAGNVTGERRFLGLFSSSANRTSVKDLPVIRRKVAEVISRSGLSERGHSGKQLLAILEDFPRDELFQTTTDELFRTVMGVLRLAGRRQVRVFARADQYGRFVSCLVYLPRDRFTTANRLRIQEILLAELHGTGLDYTTRVNDTTLARLHYIVRTGTDRGARDALSGIDTDAISARIAEATRAWDDDFAHALEVRMGSEHARRLLDRYGRALPETYKDAHTPFEAIQDLAMLEMLEEPGQLVVHLYRRRKNDEDVRFKVFRSGTDPMTLSEVLPVLHSLGVDVLDERPYEIQLAGNPVHLYDFGLRLPPGGWDVPSVRANVENAFSAAWRRESEVDQFNQLVLRAGLTWREVVVLRAYAKYLRQAGAIYSQEYMEATLAAYPHLAARLVALFHARLDPRAGDGPGGPSLQDRQARSKELTDQIMRDLDEVASLDQDRILRSFLTLVSATLRTSFYQRAADGRPKPYIAFKLDAQAISDLPEPRPRYEIFVYSPRFEGVHLRFGPVARGGLRWSDRREDFRTEILGLVKAQTVKNAVIVPVGAKGGFVLKQAPPAGDRAALQAEGVACYREFIASLLDVTDNITGGQVVAPPDVVRHDADDPYLVVAADKGTAAFSDIANEISRSYGFWLGDAFASGGSAGYDHKKMGITARGAWESAKRYLREMGTDLEHSELTVVGIGDMSGDVFGNGMLYSDHLRLVAAFDHRHIFVDPDPVARDSIVERRRLFNLPGSSWDDYDRSLISAGGGVWPRTAKSIPISEQMRRALGIADDSVTSLAPAALIRAILQAPVDLLFNGGIGTYVKSTEESHADVGDKGNDALRVNGAELRARMVVEGGNLGFTQRGRVEYALKGGQVDEHGVRHAHIATDFIDNSAGVNCSDHEVNIKILLNAAMADGALTMPERDALLAQMTDEVAKLVLRDNYDQALTLGQSRAQAASLLPVHRRMINEMEREGHLDRTLEGLPTDEELAARHAAGLGLTSPELAVLLAYSKITATRQVQSSTLPDDDWTEQVLVEYFPSPVDDMFRDRMAQHRLRRELVTTEVVNEALNRGGLSFLFRAQEETGASVADVLRAYVVVREVFDLRALWAAIEALDGTAPAHAQTSVLLQVRRLVDRAVRWLVANRTTVDVTAEIARFRPGVSALLPRLRELFQGWEREALLAETAESVAQGLPHDIADWATRVMYAFGLLDVVEVARATGRDVDQVASVYFVLSDRFRVDELLSRISALPRQDRWQTMARMALRYDLYAALAELTATVLTSDPRAFRPGADTIAEAVELVGRWEQANPATIARTTRALAEFADAAAADLAPLSVLLRQIRTLVRTSGAAERV